MAGVPCAQCQPKAKFLSFATNPSLWDEKKHLKSDLSEDRQYSVKGAACLLFIICPPVIFPDHLHCCWCAGSSAAEPLRLYFVVGPVRIERPLGVYICCILFQCRYSTAVLVPCLDQPRSDTSFPS